MTLLPAGFAEEDLQDYVWFLEEELAWARRVVYGLAHHAIEGPHLPELREAALFLGRDPDTYDPAVNPGPPP